jgi:hypothetical protein
LVGLPSFSSFPLLLPIVLLVCLLLHDEGLIIEGRVRVKSPEAEDLLVLRVLAIRFITYLFIMNEFIMMIEGCLGGLYHGI